MKMLIAVFNIILVLSFFGCKEKEASFSGGNDTGAEDLPADQSTSGPEAGDSDATADPDGFDPADGGAPLPVGDGGPLIVADIPDQVVNSGETTNSYSEVLKVTPEISGGEGQISVSYDVSGSNKGANGATFYWRPGFKDNGSYNNEVGVHQVTVTVSDEAGQSVTKTFNVDVRPIAWQAIARAEIDDVNMITDFHVFEELHPDRNYEHIGTINGTNLNTANCSAFDDSQNIQLDEDPSIVSQGKSDQGGVYDHHFVQTYKYPKAKQQGLGFDKMAFVTWLNFTPNPDDSISSDVPAKPILVFYAFARCLDGDEPSTCKKNAIGYKGMSNYFFCSDYLPNGLTKKDMYCAFARINGVPGEGC